MKERIYAALVNRHIREKYLAWRQGKPRPVALAYLLWLNLACLFRRGTDPVKSLYRLGSESGLSHRESPEAFARRLSAYDVISFDVFDTLVFRLVDRPERVFDLMGQALGYPGFARLRMAAERQARAEKNRRSGTPEVTLAEIWGVLAEMTGIPAAAGVQAELAWEKRCCYPNAYLVQVVKALLAQGKQVIAASDMYLGPAMLRQMLPDIPCYVSGRLGKAKHDGGLYRLIRETYGLLSYAHVGDHPQADVAQAKAQGVTPFFYPNVHRVGNRYRPEDMSPLTGSVYRALVNTQLHSGLRRFSRAYEYGFVYGGLFTAGFCRFIHAYREAHQLDRLLFLARDGAVLLEAYRRMYPEESAVYAYWSRLAGLKLTAGEYRQMYFDRLLFHKVGRPVDRVLSALELPELLAPLAAELPLHAKLTNKLAEILQHYLLQHWDQVLAAYAGQRSAAGVYYRRLLAGCRKAGAVDIGWAGTGPITLNCAVNRIFGLTCPVTGILAGATGDPGLAEPFLAGGQLVSYLFSQGNNRDLWHGHDPAQKHNLYWELLLSGPEGSLKGFYPGGSGGYRLAFQPNRPNPQAIREIHRGILDFVARFLAAENRLGLRLPITGRDAYAPMRTVCSPKNRGFMAELEELLDEIQVGT